MGIQAHHYISFGCPYTNVHRHRNNLFGVVYQFDKRIFTGIFQHPFTGSIPAHAIHKEHFELLFRILLKQNRLHAYINVFHFIIYRTNYGKHIFPTIFRLFGSWVECPSHHTLLHSPPSRKREHPNP